MLLPKVPNLYKTVSRLDTSTKQIKCIEKKKIFENFLPSVIDNYPKLTKGAGYGSVKTRCPDTVERRVHLFS